ncbi:MAG: hypothetical protein EWM47_12350 [Anaerolineaceae bacterium]|nr:MAG: hypothetical protein EWM47_12350 [Anaerolineaceae bacterium]
MAVEEVTEAPGSEDPEAEAPGLEDPDAEAPGSEDSEAEVPGSEDPEAEVPGSEDPEAEVPGSEDPEADVPGTEGLVVEELLAGAFLMARTVTGGAVSGFRVDEQEYEGHSYKVYLPDGYGVSADTYYPSIYLMPKNGLSSESYNEVIFNRITSLMATDEVLNMVIVLPDFTSDDDFTALLPALVADVEAKYLVIKEAKYRGILGVDVGGYMAYAAASLDPISGALFTAVGSHAGNFTNNMWTSKGSVFDAINALNRTNLNRKYYYIDAPGSDSKTTLPGSTTDIGTMMMRKTNPYVAYGMADTNFVEYTVREGYGDAFYLGALGRSLNRFSNWFTRGLITGETSLTPQAVTADKDTVSASVKLNLSPELIKFSTEVPEVDLMVTMVNPSNNQVLALNENSYSDMVVGLEKEDVRILNRSDMAPGTNTTVVVTARLLGKTFEISRLPLIRVQETGTADNEQLVDLMGDWYFNAYKDYRRNDTTFVELDSVESVVPETFTTWDVVQPAIGWWTTDFASSLNGNANRACYAWYVRTFDLAADFPKDDLLFPIGKFDEANEVYVNGVKIGSLGFEYSLEHGRYDGSNPWDVNCVYSIDTSVLNYGGTNTIAIRMCNSSGGGGWYEGPVGLYSKAAYNKAQGYPSIYADSVSTVKVLNLVAHQNDLINKKDITAYAATLSPDFFHSGYNKERKLNEVRNWMENYSDITIEDSSVGVFLKNSGYNYQAERLITGLNDDDVRVTIFEGEVNDFYIDDNSSVIQYGDHSRFFVDSYITDAINDESRVLTFRVYLPEGYFDSQERYPTSYLFHGINSTSNAFAIDKVDQILDKAIAEGRVKDMIVIIPDDPTKTSFWRGAYSDMITEDLIPTVDTRYRTIQDARYRFTAGTSMGGAGSFGIGLFNPNLFSNVISFYGALSYNDILARTQAASAEYLSRYGIYMVCGNMDSYNFFDVQAQMSRAFTSKGVPHYSGIDNGKHDSLFYIPFFDQAYAYISNRMEYYVTDDSLLNGNIAYIREDGKLSITYNLSVNDSINDYLETVPASPYTVNENPDIVIPMTILVEQNNKIVASATAYFNANGENSWTDTILLGNDDLDVTKTFTIKQYVSVLNDTKLLNSIVSVTGLNLRESSRSLSGGNTLQLNADITPADATNKSLIWTSSNPDIVSVSDTGLVRARKSGQATITVTTVDGGFTASCVITVGSSSSTPSTPPTGPTAPIVTPTPDVTPTPAPEKEKADVVVDVKVSEDNIDTSKKEMKIPVTDDLLKQFEAAEATGVNLRLKAEDLEDNSLLLGEELLAAAKKAGKDISVTVSGEDGKEKYTWTFDNDSLSTSLQEIMDVNLTLNVVRSMEMDEVGSTLGDDLAAKALVLDFNHEGILPAQASIRVYVGDQEGITAGSRIYLYHYNKQTGKLDTLPYSSQYVVDEDGYITINIVHCSDYVALTEEASPSIYASLRSRIVITPKEKTLYVSGTPKTLNIEVSLPNTLEVVSSLKDKTSADVIGAVTVKYSSSNSKIAKVDSDGKVTAVSAGKAVITTEVVLYSGKTKTVKTTITVK